MLARSPLGLRGEGKEVERLMLEGELGARLAGVQRAQMSSESSDAEFPALRLGAEGRGSIHLRRHSQLWTQWHLAELLDCPAQQGRSASPKDGHRRPPSPKNFFKQSGSSRSSVDSCARSPKKRATFAPSVGKEGEMEEGGEEEAATVPPLQRIRFRDIISGNSDPNIERVQVEYFANEKSFKSRLQLYFIKNRRSSVRIRLFNFFIKVLSCALYVVRVYLENLDEPNDPKNCIGGVCRISNHTTDNLDATADEYLTGEKGEINLVVLLWVQRPTWLYVTQAIVSVLSLLQTSIIMYISYKGNLLQLFVSWELCLEFLTSVPFIATIILPAARQLFVPFFLNCWLAKFQLQTMLNDYNRVMQRNQSAMVRQIVLLLSTLGCLLFTSTCGMQHLQRAGRMQLTLFQSFYFVVVTFSTVGYGEFYPDYWMSQLWVIGTICTAFLVLPTQLEKLAYTWVERQRSGGDYSHQRARSEKHVVLTVTVLNSEQVMDFLNEFYAHPKLQDFFVILLSPHELDQSMRLLLQVPLWSDRVIYIKGTALKDADLARARVEQAEATFILANRNQTDKILADQHTILRSWAVKDYAPKCPQYVQIFRPENKMHVKHADNVVCEDEFKYALLASNCICPGISTFITLLLHTSRGQEGQDSAEPWHRLYGRHSGNEIYHIRLSSSKFFGEYEGKSFTYASFHAHRKYGVSLVGVQKDRVGSTIQLNPGPRHILRASDTCYYMSITKEELSAFLPTSPKASKRDRRIASTIAGIGTVAMELQQTDESNSNSHSRGAEEKPLVSQPADHAPLNHNNSLGIAKGPAGRRPSIAAVPDTAEEEGSSGEGGEEEPATLSPTQRDQCCPVCGLVCVEDEDSDDRADLDSVGYRKGFPPVTPYIGTSATLCYLLKAKAAPCCLQLSHRCEHTDRTHAKDYDWRCRAIILVADHASNGLYNFIIPLRAHYRLAHELSPIVLLLEQKPDAAFLDAVSHFPHVYWMCGSIETLDNLLRAGITMADQVIVVNKEWGGGDDEYMADCNTVVTVQTIHRLFPSIHFITELAHSSNMRFMQFNAKDLYALHQSKYEKKERRRGSHIAYMFRLPFAAGYVFSANMLDTLLYQAMVKDYLIQFVRLLLGIDQALGSGYLASIRIGEEDMWIRTYGRLYQKLCAGDADVPIGIYRTLRMDDSSAVSQQVSLEMEASEAKCDSPTDAFARKYSCKYLKSERSEIMNLVRCRMETMGLPKEDYNYHSSKRGTISFVILNPSYDLKLEPGDVVYVIKTSLPMSRPSRTPSPRQVLRRSYKRPKGAGGGRAPSPKRFPASLKTNNSLGAVPAPDDHTLPTFTLTQASPCATPRSQTRESLASDSVVRDAATEASQGMVV